MLKKKNNILILFSVMMMFLGVSAEAKVRILLVPGHEPNFGGAEYSGIKERDLVLGLTEELRKYISQNKNFEVTVVRNNKGWLPEFENYFTEKWDEIKSWKNNMKAIASSTIVFSTTSQQVPHNDAPPDVAVRLYGLNKWANEKLVDVTIHIHFNDYPGHTQAGPGIYSGFSIYVPSLQYKNGPASKTLAEHVFKRLKKYNPVSDLPGESLGVVEDNSLIALGSNNTANAASLLIEYGYIYEPQLVNVKTRSLFMKDLAWQTYLGIQDFFNPKHKDGSKGTIVFPYKWTKSFEGKKSPALDVFALQTVLIKEGMYPPKGKSLNECPRSGIMGPCTVEALNAFQKKYGVQSGTGKIGPKTLRVLRRGY